MTQSNLTFTEKHDVPEGYKKTEVGVIPVDWELIKLAEIAEVKMCKRVLSAQTKKNDVIPFFKIGTFGGEPDTYISKSLYDEFRAKYSFPEKGDILISAAGTLGKTVIYDGKESYFQDSNIVWLKVDKNKISNEYLYHYYKVIQWAATEGTTIARLYNGIIYDTQILLPPINEQKIVAEALSDTDALISELEKLIEKKQAIKTATMQHLLTGKTRLPEFALREDGTPKAYKNSELGQIPEDWDVYKVGEISDVLTGFPFPSSHYTDSGVRLLRGSNVKRGVTDWSEDITQYWPIISSDIKKYELKVGDIVISMDGSLVGRSFAQLDKSDLPAVLLQRVARVRSSDVDQNYLKQWICSEMFTAHCDAVKTVTAIPHISPDDIKTFRFVAPKCKKEQKQLSGILKDMEVEIQILNEKLTKLIMFKKGMMQELLTGKTRLV